MATERGHSDSLRIRTALEVGADSTDSKDTKAPTGCGVPDSPVGAAASRSLCDAYRETIQEKVDQGLTAQRIHQDLCAEHGFTGKYSSVRRFVRGLTERTELPFRRMRIKTGHPGSGPKTNPGVTVLDPRT